MNCARQYLLQAALAARSAADRLQSGRADVQGPQHIDTVVPSTPDQRPGSHPQSTIHHHVAVSTIVQDNFREPRVPLLSTCCVELAS